MNPTAMLVLIVAAHAVFLWSAIKRWQLLRIGKFIDSRITLRDGSEYEIRWLLSKYGGTYRVRDAMVYGFWLTPFLRKIFENYVAEHGGNVKALVSVLNQ